MKPFAFSLERMRQYKEQLLNREKDLLAALRQEQAQIEQKIADTEKYKALKELEFLQKQQKGVQATEITSYQFYLENMRHVLDQLYKDLEEAKLAVERQLQVVIVATQEVSGLDKLEEKQREEYRYQEAKETELQISELVSMKICREQAAGEQAG